MENERESMALTRMPNWTCQPNGKNMPHLLNLNMLDVQSQGGFLMAKTGRERL